MPRTKQKPHPAPTGMVTGMFTDIVDSTGIKGMMEGETSSRRDARFIRDIKKPHDELILSFARDKGHMVKSTGDGFFIVFGDAEEAVLCALKIQKELSLRPIRTPCGDLRVRIGLHTGMAEITDGDYIASAMDKAARVQQHTPAGEVFISRETHALINGKVRGATFDCAGTFYLEGLEQETLFRVRTALPQTGELSPHNRDKIDESGGRRQPNTIRPPKKKATLTFVNPYSFDTTASRQTFKGREKEIDDLLDSLETGTHTAIFGLQRMGKTSLISEGLEEGLGRRPDLKKSILPVKIDLQNLGGDQVKYRDFVQAIMSAIGEKLDSLGIGRGGQNIRALTNEFIAASRFQRGDRTQFFASFGNLLRGFTAAAHRRVVLFIDEFSEVRKVIERNKMAWQKNPLRTGGLLPHDMYIDVPFIHHLGSMLKNPELKNKFILVVLVRPFMSEYDDREGLQILKLMKPITLYHLGETAAKALITEPLREYVHCEDGAVGYLYRITSGHPYLLQFILNMVVTRIRRDRRAIISLKDIQEVEELMISEGPAFDAQFAVLCSDYSVAEVLHPEEARLGKGTLALIAHLGQNQTDERWVSNTSILNMLLEHKIPKQKAWAILSQLTRTKILEESSRQGELHYRILVPLLSNRFVRQNMFLKYFHYHSPYNFGV